MKRLHLICNAHIDPIWQWTWDEGIASAIATFKSAADLAEEFDYIFCHNESLLYEAIEENAPELFERIKRLVKQGRWRITGGWYLQPDVLMPSGETILREIAVGREYFKEKFDTVPTVATNFDSFGHSVGLVQILKKTGHNGYIFCRPNPSQFKYPSRFFKWSGPDGSSIVATESFSYNSLLGKATEKIKSAAAGAEQAMLGSDNDNNAAGFDSDVDYVLWGVGNHGGGPSRKDLSDIEKLEIDGVELLHSTPEALFSDGIKIDGEVKTSLVTCMPGCYTSMARVKGGFRRVENMFYATEKMLAAASLIGLSVNPDGMKKAERHLLLTTFHDIIPGTVIEDAEGEALATLGAAERILLDYRTRAFLYLTMNERCAGEGEYPVFVFNYAPYEVNTLVEAEFSLADQNWENCIFSPHVYDECGRELPSQTIKERSTLNLDWRKRIIFKATLSPLGITRFTVKCTPVPVFDKKATRVGALTEFFGKSTVIEAPCALEMYDDTADPWGMSREELLAVGKNPTPFREMSEKESARYLGYEGELSPLRIVEDGDIYTMLEGFYTEGATNAALKYRLYKNEPYIDVQATVEYADKNKLVRIKVPIPADMSGALPVGDGPFVWESKPNVGEVCFQKWLGVKRDDEVFAVINNGIYGGKVEDGFIHLTLLRGAGYCIHPIQERELYPHDRYLPRIESGRYTFNFRIIRGTLAKVFAAAEEFNQPPYAVNVFPTGGGSSAASARINVTGDVCVPTVNKRDDGSYLIRLYNPSEQASSATVSFGDVSCEVELSAAEVATAILCDGKFNVYHETLPV